MYCYVSSIFSSFILAVVSRYGSTIKKEEDYKQTAPETLQRSQTHRQTKSIYRRNNRDIRVVNNEDSNRNNEGSHTNEQLQSIPPGIPTIDYALLAREIIKQQGLMNSNNSSAGDQAFERQSQHHS
jgi:hypothetical protein